MDLDKSFNLYDEISYKYNRIGKYTNTEYNGHFNYYNYINMVIKYLKIGFKLFLYISSCIRNK